MSDIQYVNAKQEIFNLLAQVETLLLETTCDGDTIAGTRWGDEIEDALSTLVQAVDYYID